MSETKRIELPNNQYPIRVTEALSRIELLKYVIEDMKRKKQNFIVANMVGKKNLYVGN